MKKIKLSKMAWLILSAGIFVVVLAGLGFTYSGQKSEQNTLKADLEISKTRLQKTEDTGAQQQQIDQLEERLADSQTRLDEAKGKFVQAILSVDVTEKFFQIAESSGVSVRSFGTTDIQSTKVAGVNCSKITMHGMVEGELLELVNFIVNLNQNYITGYVTTAQITVAGEADENSTANIQLEAYSSKGTNDGK